MAVSSYFQIVHALFVFLLLMVLAFVPAVQAEPGGAENHTCASFDAIYRPSPGFRDSDYVYELAVVGNKQLGSTEENIDFVLSTLTKKERNVLSKLHMPYSCTGSGAMMCRASFIREYHYDDKPTSVQVKEFPIVALNKDFSRSQRNVTYEDAPYVLIFPQLTQAVYYTRDWDQMEESIEYMTPEKVPPQLVPEVWLLSECKQ